MSHKRTSALLLLALALAGCGASQKSSSQKNASAASGRAVATATASSGASQFATHAGLAFGTFYRYIFTPYREGRLKRVPANAAELAVAARAAAYVATQVGSAAVAARGDASLQALVGPLDVLDQGFASALAELKQGRFKLSEIDAANIAISSIKGIAVEAGMPIRETSPEAL